MGSRSDNILAAEKEIFDVAIIGGGINGACLFDNLRRAGYQVILLDKGDFAGGTSQASAMMVWGGLLYLAGLDLKTVFSLSTSRDSLINEMPGWVTPKKFGILPASNGILGKQSILLALQLYWLIGRFNRQRANIEPNYPGKSLLKTEVDALVYEEGFLRHSDARFVLHWLLGHSPPSGVILNYADVIGGQHQRGDNLWHAKIRDLIEGRELTIRARAIANCAGTWTDQVNSNFGIQSPIKHVFSKGVFIGFEREEQQATPLIFDTGEHGDVICSIPWGPIELWGPTETRIDCLESGFEVIPEDVRYLLKQRKRHFKATASKNDIVSLRAGVRPLAVEASYHGSGHTLKLSRKPQIIGDSGVPWVSVYGGKITNCVDIAKASTSRLATMLPPPASLDETNCDTKSNNMKMTQFPGLESKVATMGWCKENEFCCTLEDYLRRRTNIAQWVPREGLSRSNENDGTPHKLCLELANGNKAVADQHLAEYRVGVEHRFDKLLNSV
jgi:glycerol-3-phosphate dehydrogenase